MSHAYQFITTRYGHDFHYNPDETTPSLPSREDLIEEVAYTLDRIPRFAGATERVITTCNHSRFVAKLVHAAGGDFYTQLLALMHDAHEYVISDIPTPFQNFCTMLNGGKDVISLAKKRIDSILMPHFGFTWPPQEGIWDMVKMADATACYVEASKGWFVTPGWVADFAERSPLLDIKHAKFAPLLASWNHFQEHNAFEFIRDFEMLADEIGLIDA